MSDFPNEFDPFGSNSSNLYSSLPSQTQDNNPQNANVPPPRPIFNHPNMAHPGYPPPGYLQPGYTQQGYIPPGYIPPGYLHQGYLPQGYAHQGHIPQASMLPNSSRMNNIDLTPAEQGTPSSGRSAVQGLDNINLNVDPQTGDDGDATSKQRVIYTEEESNHLAKCWIDTSIDSVVGDDQTGEQMWERIAFSYNKLAAKKKKRKACQLKAHFYKVQKQTKNFESCYERCMRLWGSGCSEADILQKAQKEYMELHASQGFKYISVWKILRECPKFAEVEGDIHAPKRTKNSAGGAYTSSSNAEDAAMSRPMGQKAAKRKAKGKGKKDELTAATEAAKEHGTNAAKYIQLYNREVRMKEYDIIMKDTSYMSEMQKSVHEKTVASILAKWKDEE